MSETDTSRDDHNPPKYRSRAFWLTEDNVVALLEFATDTSMNLASPFNAPSLEPLTPEVVDTDDNQHS